jgi:hypothetical protein
MLWGAGHAAPTPSSALPAPVPTLPPGVGAIVRIAPAAPAEPAPEPAVVSADEAAAIVQSLRKQAAGLATAFPATLNRPGGGVILSFHSEPLQASCLSLRGNLASALGDAGEELARRMARLPDRAKALREGRLQLDFLLPREAIEFKDRITIWKGLAPGLDGLLTTSEGRTAGFAPAAVLRHWHALDLVLTLYRVQEGELPPPAFKAERFRTQSFIENAPGGRVVPFTRGIVALDALQPAEAIEAVARAGLWLLRTQQQNGSFFPRYSPSAEAPAAERYNYAEHLRAMFALTLLYEVTADPKFDDAFDRALAHLYEAKLIRTEDRYTWVPLEENDDITGTALLLSALCGRALTHPGPTVSALMRQLGESLTVLTSEDGRMYARILNARHRLPPYQLRGVPHAEALAALTLLLRISPGDKAQAAAERIADVISVVPEFKTLKTKDGKAPADMDPGRFVLTHSDARTMARVLEALADFDRQSRKEKHLPAVRDLAVQLMNSQAGAGRGLSAESVGGVPEGKDIPADTQTTGTYLAAIAAAYDFSMANRRQEEPLAMAARRAALYLANMQYRPESLLRLPRPEVLLGAFRRAPDDMTVQTFVTVECVRGLIRGVPVLAENLTPGAEAPRRTAAPDKAR